MQLFIVFKLLPKLLRFMSRIFQLVLICEMHAQSSLCANQIQNDTTNMEYRLSSIEIVRIKRIKNKSCYSYAN